MKKYNVYGMGAALVDTEIEVDDAFLGSAGIDKGVMTLVDEARQDRLLELLSTHLVASRRASGGSAANAPAGTASTRDTTSGRTRNAAGRMVELRATTPWAGWAGTGRSPSPPGS